METLRIPSRGVLGGGLFLGEGADAVDEVIDAFGGEARMDGQGDEAFGERVGHGELALLEAAFLEGGGPMQGDVVGADAYAALFAHGVDEVFLVHAEDLGVNLQGVKVEDVFAAGHDGGEGESGHALEAFGDARADVDALLIQGIKLLELGDADGGLDIGHAEVVAAVVKVLPPEALAHRQLGFVQRAVLRALAIDARAVGTVEGDALEDLRIVGGDDAAFAQGAHVLLFVETEAAGGAHAAGLAALIFRAHGMAGVFDDGEAVLFG